MLDVGVGVLWLVDRVSIKWERRSRDVSQPTWAVRVVACGIWGSVAETKILEWWSRNSKDKYWFTFGITLKLRVKIVGIPPKKEWHWLWRSGIIWTSPSSALTLKWDVSAAKMSKLTLFLQKELKDIYSRHLAEKMNECVTCLCYGCVHAKDSRVMHNLCSMHALDQVRFCIYFALDFVDEAAIMEQYGNEVGLAAFEWCGSGMQTFHLERVVQWCH